jgi:hypothetical protein
MPAGSTPPPPLLINGQPIEIVEDFKYLGSYMASTDKDINARIALAWAAFAKLKSILSSRSGKPTSRLGVALYIYNVVNLQFCKFTDL